MMYKNRNNNSFTFSKKIIGRLGELVSCVVYVLMFYRIIGTRVRNSCGEIDIIAKRFNTIAFIEVKSRVNASMIDENIISIKQRKRIVNAAKMFLSQKRIYDNLTIRFDLVIVSNIFFPRIIRNAWLES